MIQARKWPAQLVLDEINTVDGERCGRSCEHHGLTCARAAGHDGAQVLDDMHAAVVNGQPVAFGEECCTAEEEAG